MRQEISAKPRQTKQKRVCQNRHALFTFIVSQAAQQDETFFPSAPVFFLPVVSQRGKGADWTQNAAVQG